MNSFIFKLKILLALASAGVVVSYTTSDSDAAKTVEVKDVIVSDSDGYQAEEESPAEEEETTETVQEDSEKVVEKEEPAEAEENEPEAEESQEYSSLLKFEPRPLKGFNNPYIPQDEKLGKDLASRCSSDYTYHIKVPKNHFDSESEQINYHYSISHPKNRDKDSVYIMNIPGGPGGHRMTQIESMIKQYPENAGVITVDPRGLGCNLYPDSVVKKEELATKQHARDLALILKAENLKKYIILGGSYGTIVATHLVHYIEQHETFPKPIGTIMMGTLGKAHKDFSFNQPFVSLLEIIKDPNKAAGQNLFRQALIKGLKPVLGKGFDIPLAFRQLFSKYDRLEKGTETQKKMDLELYYTFIAVYSGMKEGAARISAAIDLVKLMSLKYLSESSINETNDLKALNAGDIQKKIDYIIGHFKPFGNLGEAMMDRISSDSNNSSKTKELIDRSKDLRDQIICNELGWRKELIQLDKNPYLVVLNEEEKCDAKEYFDAKDFPIKGQILYLQGGLDLQTTPEQAEYHIKTQSQLKNSRTYNIVSLLSGHSFAYDYNFCGVWEDYLLKGDFRGFVEKRLSGQQSHCPIPFLRYTNEELRFYRATDGAYL